MQTPGARRRIDRMGRVAIPSLYLSSLGLNPHAEVTITRDVDRFYVEAVDAATEPRRIRKIDEKGRVHLPAQDRVDVHWPLGGLVSVSLDVQGLRFVICALREVCDRCGQGSDEVGPLGEVRRGIKVCRGCAQEVLRGLDTVSPTTAVPVSGDAGAAGRGAR